MSFSKTINRNRTLLPRYGSAEGQKRACSDRALPPEDLSLRRKVASVEPVWQ